MDDNKDIIGCEVPQKEEALQQIAHTYIEPPVNLAVFTIEKDNKKIIMRPQHN